MEAILLKTKLNTKDEADNGSVCFAFSGCWGAPGEGKLREGQDPNPRNSRNNTSQSRDPGGPGGTMLGGWLVEE